MKDIDAIEQFPETVEKEFEFILNHCFACVQSDESCVRYERDDSFVQISFDRSMLGLHFGPLAQAPKRAGYTVAELLELIDPERGERYRDYIRSEIEDLATGIQRLAALFSLIVESGLLERAELFSELASQRAASPNDSEEQTRLVAQRRDLDLAWREKRYSDVVQLLDAYGGTLSASDSAKLEYARKRSLKH